MTVENLRNFLETTAKLGFFGPEKVHEGAKERRKEEEKREKRRLFFFSVVVVVVVVGHFGDSQPLSQRGMT